MKVLGAIACFLFSVSLCLQAQSPTSAAPNAQPSAPQQPSPGDKIITSQPEIDPVKLADIDRLLDLTGAENIALDTMNEMSKNIKPLMTNALPPGDYREQLIDLFYAKFQSKADPKFFRTIAVPVYDKYYSDQELKGLIEFYSTPLGQKMLGVLPKMMADLRQGGRKWGEGLGRESMLEVLSEHPELAKALEEAKKAQKTQSQ
jgi:uncharacterized protein